MWEVYRNVELDLTGRFWDLADGGEGQIMEAWHQGTQATLTSWDAESIRAAAVLTATMTALSSTSSEAHVDMSDFAVAESPTAAEIAQRVEGDAAAAGKEALAQWRKYQKSNADLVREVFGNPFRPVAVDPAWLTPTVTALAGAAYEQRQLPSGTLDYARLAVLADALEEAGCTDAGLLHHLRERTPHVRGCWAVDLLLARK